MLESASPCLFLPPGRLSLARLLAKPRKLSVALAKQLYALLTSTLDVLVGGEAVVVAAGVVVLDLVDAVVVGVAVVVVDLVGVAAVVAEVGLMLYGCQGKPEAEPVDALRTACMVAASASEADSMSQSSSATAPT